MQLIDRELEKCSLCWRGGYTTVRPKFVNPQFDKVNPPSPQSKFCIPDPPPVPNRVAAL